MGDIISKKAAIFDIVADCKTTLLTAEARGAVQKTIAEQYLQAPLSIFELVDERCRTAEEALLPFLAKLDAVDDSTDAFLGRIADEIWNDFGRPAADPLYSLLFPEGVGFYTDSPDAEQPARMEILAELLEANLHGRLDAKKAKSLAKQVRDAARNLREAVEATLGLRAQVNTLGRARTAIARSMQMSLVNLKRHYRATGLSEAEVHALIPAHARPVAKKPVTPPPPLPPTA